MRSSAFLSRPKLVSRTAIGGPAALALAVLAAQASVAAPEAPRKPGALEPGTPVMVARAVNACFSSVVHATGYLVAREEAVVEFPIEGYEIAEVLARDSETVQKSQPLVKLVRAPGVSQGGQSNLTSALPATIVLEAIAPGRIISATAIVGALTSPRLPPLFRIAIDGTIEADAEVSSIHLAKIAIDQPARLTPEGSAEVRGHVRTIAGAVDAVTQMGHVRIAIDGDVPPGAGRFVHMTIDTGESCGISVPLAAVQRSTEGTSVQVVRGNLVETVRVRVGEAANDRIEVQAGLKQGDVVVAHAGTSLRDGDRVAPEFLDAPPPTGHR